MPLITLPNMRDLVIEVRKHVEATKPTHQVVCADDPQIHLIGFACNTCEGPTVGGPRPWWAVSIEDHAAWLRDCESHSHRQLISLLFCNGQGRLHLARILSLDHKFPSVFMVPFEQQVPPDPDPEKGATIWERLIESDPV